MGPNATAISASSASLSQTLNYSRLQATSTTTWTNVSSTMTPILPHDIDLSIYFYGVARSSLKWPLNVQSLTDNKLLSMRIN